MDKIEFWEGRAKPGDRVRDGRQLMENDETFKPRLFFDPGAFRRGVIRALTPREHVEAWREMLAEWESSPEHPNYRYQEIGAEPV
jgi:hypothetical protein